MREIKFRAWDKEEKKMADVRLENIRRADTGDYSFTDGEIDHGEYLELDEVELMQYTGLKDKNGKEIYEGDVLRHDSGINGEVLYLTHGFYCFPIEAGGNLDLEGDMIDDFKESYMNDINSSFKIIGNIYENPNLIKK